MDFFISLIMILLLVLFVILSASLIWTRQSVPGCIFSAVGTLGLFPLLCSCLETIATVLAWGIAIAVAFAILDSIFG